VAAPKDLSKVFGPLEAEVMQAVWKADAPVSVREVLAQLNRRRSPPLAYTTVMTVMSRLAGKRVLTRAVDGRGYRYTAALPDEAAIAVREVVRDFGEAAIAQFVDEARADPKLLRRLQKLLGDDR
jgi:predicted transcriptional regulator